ncbi:hypothetical protein V865_007793 [Kwoniella europaea PYCC6329]|uniref:Uncharacterized protein n=1 Tax=Kwoniella europaea PYCC6329 TaxID=1423913 RepID=A0AAX4KT94_9TREE
MPYSDTFDRRPWLEPLDEDRRKALIQTVVEQNMINLKDILARNIGDEDAIKTFVENEKPSWSGIFNFHDKDQTIYATWSARNESRGVICSGKGSEVRGDLLVVSPDP